MCIRDRYHPDRIELGEELEVFIRERSDRAALEFEQSFLRTGNNQEADRQASEILFADLEFSRYIFIRDLLEKNFESLYKKWDNESRMEKEVIWIVDKLKDKFSEFDTTDNFQHSDKMDYTFIGHMVELFEKHNLE